MLFKFGDWVQRYFFLFFYVFIMLDKFVYVVQYLLSQVNWNMVDLFMIIILLMEFYVVYYVFIMFKSVIGFYDSYFMFVVKKVDLDGL